MNKNAIGQTIALLFLLTAPFKLVQAESQKIALPNQLHAPEATEGSYGIFMSPYTVDGVLTPWVSKAIKLKVGEDMGALLGTYLGKMALGSVPILGGIIGSEIGEESGKELALDAVGGWDYLKETSDQSFYSVKNMAVFLYVKHSTHKHYKDALAATFVFYPQLKDNYFTAIKEASDEAFAFEVEF